MSASSENIATGISQPFSPIKSHARSNASPAQKLPSPSKIAQATALITFMMLNLANEYFVSPIASGMRVFSP